jgi:O-acetyl-ADP-ribose deacetylase (regulator of RNase III)
MKNIILKSKIRILNNVHKFLVKLNTFLMSKTDEPQIYYLKGDATNPIETGGDRLITHICNDKGGWGAGFVLALSKKWSKPEQMYRSIPISQLILGTVQYVSVDRGILVVNMIAQHGYRNSSNGKPPIRYDALVTAFKEISKRNEMLYNPTIHMPKIGTGLAGGDWDVIEQLIIEHINCPVYVYELN